MKDESFHILFCARKKMPRVCMKNKLKSKYLKTIMMITNG